MKSRFFEENYFDNKKLTKDIHNIEDFIEDLSTNQLYSSLKKSTKEEVKQPKETRNISKMKKKFYKMTK